MQSFHAATEDDLFELRIFEGSWDTVESRIRDNLVADFRGVEVKPISVRLDGLSRSASIPGARSLRSRPTRSMPRPRSNSAAQRRLCADEAGDPRDPRQGFGLCPGSDLSGQTAEADLGFLVPQDEAQACFDAQPPAPATAAEALEAVTHRLTAQGLQVWWLDQSRADVRRRRGPGAVHAGVENRIRRLRLHLASRGVVSCANRRLPGTSRRPARGAQVPADRAWAYAHR